MTDWLSEIEEKVARLRDDYISGGGIIQEELPYERMARVLRELAGVAKHVKDFEPGDAMVALRDLSDDAKELLG